ncbi:MAG TPA: hypothetical protein VFJ85_06600 [Acidimicrobiales bacterium]|nr:hypothetical protein [Acidimicrobiales bacterium]
MTAARRAGRLLLAVLAAYLVVRAVVEVVTVHPGHPASYRDDWGGPTYPGVLAVHVLPGVLAAVLAWRWIARRR